MALVAAKPQTALMRFALFATLPAFAACSSYASVRDEASSMLADVAACNEGDTCVAVDGIEGDCTGELSCPFPARTDRAGEAHARASDIAKRSRNYSQCATAFCSGAASDFSATCDPQAHHCTMSLRNGGIDGGNALTDAASE